MGVAVRGGEVPPMGCAGREVRVFARVGGQEHDDDKVACERRSPSKWEAKGTACVCFIAFTSSSSFSWWG